MDKRGVLGIFSNTPSGDTATDTPAASTPAQTTSIDHPSTTASVVPTTSLAPTSSKPSSSIPSSVHTPTLTSASSSSIPTILPSTSIALVTGSPSASITATPSATNSPDNSGDNSFPTAMIAGVSAVIFVVAASLAGFVFYSRWKRRRQEKAWAMQELFKGTPDDPSVLSSDPIYRDGEADNIPLPKNWNDPYAQPYSPHQQQPYTFYQQAGVPQSPFPARAPGTQPSYYY